MAAVTSIQVLITMLILITVGFCFPFELSRAAGPAELPLKDDLRKT